MEKKAKVFSMNDCDWWADYSKEEAEKNYLKYTGTTAEDELWDEDEPSELSDKDLNRPHPIIHLQQ